MRKYFYFIPLFLAIMTCTACSTNEANINLKSLTSIKVDKINNTLMVKSKDIADLLKMQTYINEEKMICFEQDEKIVKLSFNSQYVFQYRYRVDYLKNNPINKAGTVYIPLTFLTKYLKIKGELKDSIFYPVNISDFSLYNVIKFLPEEIYNSYNDENYPNRNKILNQIDKPRSMGINIPKFDISRCIMVNPINNKQKEILLYNYKYNNPKEIKILTNEDYKTIERSLLLDKEIINLVKERYVDLADENLSDWTYGELNDYYDKNNKEGYLANEKQQFNKRGILPDDISILKKYYYNTETILAKTDDDLKEKITADYKFRLDLIRDYANKYPTITTYNINNNGLNTCD